MSFYLLRLRRERELEEELESADLPDLDAAHVKALRVVRELRELWSDLPADVLDDMAIEIADEADQVVLTIPFSEVGRWVH
jgi:hypothetical protein